MSEDRGWQDVVVGERMQVDRDFAERVRDSPLSKQQWGLVMTAADFEIERPDDPTAARIVADTSKLSSIMPELEAVGQQAGPVAGQSAGGGAGGLLSRVKEVLGLGGGGDRERQAAAERLLDEYAEALQERIESEGRWEDVCAIAATGVGSPFTDEDA